ncbi:MAG: TlyA family RNA methyltransferase [Clostridia bacterium]|nr:TlyA family RNA methyltransferase [Clostridia bacterium]
MILAEKVRLDLRLFELGYTESREKARALIMAGQVYVNDQKKLKAGYAVKPTDTIEVRGKTLKYVSRGGLKLEKALAEFPITLDGKVCMDVGASTGGFTDCMLQNGAVKVYSVDVGYGQLAWKLRNDDRVINLERTNFRYIENDVVSEKIDFASVDVSFISLKLIFPKLRELLSDSGQAVCLIKPQFEAGRENVGKKGVVRDPQIHIDVIEQTIINAKENNFIIKGLTFSPVKGPEGNIEYLVFLGSDGEEELDFDIKEVVASSHNLLDK